jgi:hypothetical protein
MPRVPLYAVSHTFPYVGTARAVSSGATPIADGAGVRTRSRCGRFAAYNGKRVSRLDSPIRNMYLPVRAMPEESWMSTLLAPDTAASSDPAASAPVAAAHPRAGAPLACVEAGMRAMHDRFGPRPSRAHAARGGRGASDRTGLQCRRGANFPRLATFYHCEPECQVPARYAATAANGRLQVIDMQREIAALAAPGQAVAAAAAMFHGVLRWNETGGGWNRSPGTWNRSAGNRNGNPASWNVPGTGNAGVPARSMVGAPASSGGSKIRRAGS